jgi:hypothetical protein
MKFATLFLTLFLISSIKAQSVVNLRCLFWMSVFRYECRLIDAIVPNDQNVNVVFSGSHDTGRSNDDVSGMMVMYGDIPFILPQFFTTFPNLAFFEADHVELLRIQAGGFRNAGHLTDLFIRDTLLSTIEPNAFVGASKLTRIVLIDNVELKQIDENIFNGLTVLRTLDLSRNGISSININAFRPLTSLVTLILTSNSLTSLNGRLLSNNGRIATLNINNNQIKSIGRDFLNGKPNLSIFSALNNVCISRSFMIEGAETIDSVHAALSVCYANAA